MLTLRCRTINPDSAERLKKLVLKKIKKKKRKRKNEKSKVNASSEIDVELKLEAFIST